MLYKYFKTIIYGLISMCMFTYSSQAQTTYYVDGTNGSNASNGQSWANAKKDIPDAMNLTSSGDQVWVMSGTYSPSQDHTFNSSPSDPRRKTFYIKDGVKLYGGFSSANNTFASRNPKTNVTILDGNLGIVK